MHWIQYDILFKLTRVESARYSELRPKDVEGNLFMYHLGKLIQQGLVEKHNHDYMLTEQGREDAASLRLTARKHAVPPQANVAVLYEVVDKTVLYRWNRAPYRNQISLPFGRVDAGNSLMEMAAIQLHYKTGLEPRKLTMAGTVDLQLFHDHKLVRHQIIHVVRAEGPDGAVSADGLTGHPFWAEEGTSDGEWVAGYQDIMTLARSTDGVFFRELQLHE